MGRFEVGDRVRVRQNAWRNPQNGVFNSEMRGNAISGITRIIMRVENDGGHYDYRCDDGYYYCDRALEAAAETIHAGKKAGIMIADEVLKDSEDKITITVDGKTVTAKYKDRTAVAKCPPEDTFDLRTGVELAVSRLVLPRAPFRPKQGERYWFVSRYGADVIRNECTTFDYQRISMGNCYRTEDEAAASDVEYRAKSKEFFAYAK